MDSLLKILSGPVPVGLVILLLVVVNYVKVNRLEKDVHDLKEHFINHLKYHAKGGGEKDGK